MRQGLVIMGERQIQRKYCLWDVEFVLHALAHALIMPNRKQMLVVSLTNTNYAFSIVLDTADFLSSQTYGNNKVCFVQNFVLGKAVSE